MAIDLPKLPKLTVPKAVQGVRLSELPARFTRRQTGPRSPGAGYRYERAKRIGSGALGMIGGAGLLTVAAVALGFMTSQHLIENPSRINAQSAGSWVVWPSAGRVDADPYTRARFMRQGSLPLGYGIARTYEARYDSDGQRLHSSCEYGLTAEGVEGAWWSISVFDERGRIIANPAERYAYTSRNIMRGPDGAFLIALSRDARPGNWLPTAGAGRLVLHLTVIGFDTTPTAGDQSTAARALPVIRRVACR